MCKLPTCCVIINLTHCSVNYAYLHGQNIDQDELFKTFSKDSNNNIYLPTYYNQQVAGLWQLYILLTSKIITLIFELIIDLREYKYAVWTVQWLTQLSKNYLKCNKSLLEPIFYSNQINVNTA